MNETAARAQNENIKNEVINGMIAGGLQVAPKEQPKERPKHLSVIDDTRKPSQSTRRQSLAHSSLNAKPSAWVGREEKGLPAYDGPLPSRYNKEEYLKSLKKGDIIAVRGWSLAPPCGIVIVKATTATTITGRCGRKFDRSTGFSIDGSRLLLTPLSTRTLWRLIQSTRKRLLK